MKTLLTTTAALIASSLCLPLPAQEQEKGSLLFTVLARQAKYERTLQIKPQSLSRIYGEDVAAVTPAKEGAAYSARKFAPHDAYGTLYGDEDNDNEFWEDPLAGRVDACLWTPKGSGRSMRRLYVSVRDTIEDHVNTQTGLPGMPATARPGDVFRVIRDSVALDGQFRFLLREEQIRDAFKIPATVKINVDAVTAVWDAKVIYLSFEEDVTVTVPSATGAAMTVLAKDGSILGINVNAIGEPCTVASSSGFMVASEAEVDAMVTASGIRDHNGALVTTIRDLDGLHPAARGGKFKSKWGTFHNLMFCGESLTGCGIVTTAGTIAQINGRAMGSSVGATTGRQVGLHPLAVSSTSSKVKAGSLNGLHVRAAKGVALFVTETPAPVLYAGSGTLSVDIEGIGPGVAVLLFDVATLPIHGLNPVGGPVLNTWFPQFIVPTPMPFLFVPLNASGIGNFSVAAQPLDLKLIFQAFQLDGNGYAASTPCTIELYKSKPQK